MLADAVISGSNLKPAGSGNLGRQERVEGAGIRENKQTSYSVVDHEAQQKFNIALVSLKGKGAEGMKLEPDLKDSYRKRRLLF